MALYPVPSPYERLNILGGRITQLPPVTFPNFDMGGGIASAAARLVAVGMIVVSFATPVKATGVLPGATLTVSSANFDMGAGISRASGLSPGSTLRTYAAAQPSLASSRLSGSILTSRMDTVAPSRAAPLVAGATLDVPVTNFNMGLGVSLAEGRLSAGQLNSALPLAGTSLDTARDLTTGLSTNFTLGPGISSDTASVREALLTGTVSLAALSRSHGRESGALLTGKVNVAGFIRSACRATADLGFLPPLVQDTTNQSFGSQSGGTSLTISHTVAAGTNRILLFALWSKSASVNFPTTVTYGGVGLTACGNAASNNNGTDYIFSQYWYLIAPTVGTANIVATFPSATVHTRGSGLVVTGALQSASVIYSIAQNSAFGTTPTNTLGAGLSTTHLVLDAAAANEAPGFTVGAGQTQLYNAGSAGVLGVGMSTELGAASVTMDWTLATAKMWSSFAVTITNTQAPSTPITGGISRADGRLKATGIKMVHYATPTRGMHVRNQGRLSAFYGVTPVRSTGRLGLNFIVISQGNLSATPVLTGGRLLSLHLKLHYGVQPLRADGRATGQLQFTGGTTTQLAPTPSREVVSAKGQLQFSSGLHVALEGKSRETVRLVATRIYILYFATPSKADARLKATFSVYFGVAPARSEGRLLGAAFGLNPKVTIQGMARVAPRVRQATLPVRLGLVGVIRGDSRAKAPPFNSSLPIIGGPSRDVTRATSQLEFTPTTLVNIQGALLASGQLTGATMDFNPWRLLVLQVRGSSRLHATLTVKPRLIGTSLAGTRLKPSVLPSRLSPVSGNSREVSRLTGQLQFTGGTTASLEARSQVSGRLLGAEVIASAKVLQGRVRASMRVTPATIVLTLTGTTRAQTRTIALPFNSRLPITSGNSRETVRLVGQLQFLPITIVQIQGGITRTSGRLTGTAPRTYYAAQSSHVTTRLTGAALNSTVLAGGLIQGSALASASLGMTGPFTKSVEGRSLSTSLAANAWPHTINQGGLTRMGGGTAWANWNGFTASPTLTSLSLGHPAAKGNLQFTGGTTVVLDATPTFDTARAYADLRTIYRAGQVRANGVLLAQINLKTPLASTSRDVAMVTGAFPNPYELATIVGHGLAIGSLTQALPLTAGPSVSSGVLVGDLASLPQFPHFIFLAKSRLFVFVAKDRAFILYAKDRQFIFQAGGPSGTI